MLTLEIQRFSTSLKRGLKPKSCSWESVNWTNQGFEQSLWSALQAIISMLVFIADENVFIGRDLFLQGARQMLGRRDGIWRGVGPDVILHSSPELAEGSTATQHQISLDAVEMP